MDLQQFYYYRVPGKVKSLKEFTYLTKDDKNFNPLNVSYERYLQAWSEHDAIHYLLNLPFSDYGERKVAHVEEHCQVGWLPVDERYSGYLRQKIIFDLPEGFGRNKIVETAEKLRELY